MADEPVVRLIDLHKRFGDLVVLDGVSLDIPRGLTTAILGPSGAGKSVLLKHIVGLIPPDRGKVLVGGVDMAHASERQKYAVREKFGMLFQGGALFDSMTAGENVEFPLRYHRRLSSKERRRIAQEKLELVDLPDLYDRPTPALSGGQRKRVALARAIVLEPEVVVFDEPNSGLDPVTSATIDELIVRMQHKLGITFLIITHDIVQALAVADRIGMLWKGKLVEYGTKDEFLHSPYEVVRRFLARNVDLPEPSGPIIPADD